MRQDKNKGEEDRRRPVARSFNNWLQAFCIYASVVGERSPEKCVGMFQHIDIVLEAYKNFGGLGWYFYDESFRQKMSVYSNLKWGMKDVGLWLNLILPQRATPIRPPSTSVSVTQGRKGICFAFNESQCHWASACKYKHECSFCAGQHPFSRCYKKSVASASKDIFSKGLHASEAPKHVALASTLSRQGEGSTPN